MVKDLYEKYVHIYCDPFAPPEDENELNRDLLDIYTFLASALGYHEMIIDVGIENYLKTKDPSSCGIGFPMRYLEKHSGVYLRTEDKLEEVFVFCPICESRLIGEKRERQYSENFESFVVINYGE